MMQVEGGSLVEIGVGDPWFSAIRAGDKTVEGRLHKGKFAGLAPGQVLAISKSGSTRTRKLVAVVTRVVRYTSFHQYLCQEGLARTLPGVHTIEAGIAVYRRFYPVEQEREHGVAAIHITLL